MTARPTPGGSTGTWGSELNAWLDENMGFANGMAKAFGAKAWTIPPNLASTNYQTTTGYLHGCPILLSQGDVITGVGAYFQTAGAGATNCQLGILNSSFTRQAVTANTPTAAQTAGYQLLPLTSPWTVPSSGLYFLADVITATTMPFWASSLAIPGGSSQHTMPAALGGKIYSMQDTTGFTSIPLNPPSPSAGSHMHLMLAY